MNWRAIYEPLLGQELEGIAFMPITCDTPLVLSHLGQPRHWFSGAVCVGFANAADLFLTWQHQRQTLEATALLEWARFSLDRVTISPEAPWDALHRATLSSVHLFGDRELQPEDIVAARHDFATAQGIVNFWVCTGNETLGHVGEGDDLYVGLEAPENLKNLTTAHAIRRDR